MPRQPLKFLKKEPRYSIGHDSLSERPHLAALVARCISTWAQIDLQLSLSLAAILKTSSEAAAAVYLSLQNARAQRDALESAARVSLSEADLRVFLAVMAVHKSLSGERNDLAHGIFGIVQDESDWLLWHPSSQHAAWLTEVYRAEQQRRANPDPHARLRDELFVYKKGDLESLHAGFCELWWAAFELHGYLKESGPYKEGALNRLKALPRIQAELARS